MKCLEIIGNLGNNAECVKSADGSERMRFSIAVSAKDKGTIWFNVLARMQKRLFPYLQKGKRLYVRGNFDLNTYNGKPDITIFPDKLELCEKMESVTAEPAEVTTAEPDTY